MSDEIPPATPPVVETPPVIPPAVVMTAPVLPAAYNFKVPEGVPLDAGVLEARAKALLLSEMQAKLFLDMTIDEARKRLTSSESKRTEQIAAQEKELASLSLPDSVVNDGRSTLEAAVPGLTKFLQDMGVDRNPMVMRVLHHVGKGREDSPQIRGKPETKVDPPRDELEAFNRKVAALAK